MKAIVVMLLFLLAACDPPMAAVHEAGTAREAS